MPSGTNMELQARESMIQTGILAAKKSLEIPVDGDDVNGIIAEALRRCQFTDEGFRHAFALGAIHALRVVQERLRP